MDPIVIVRLIVGLIALAVPLLNPVFTWKFNRGHYRRGSSLDDSMSWEMIGALIWMVSYVQGVELLMSACLIGLGLGEATAHSTAILPAIIVAWALAKPIGAYVTRRYQRHEKQLALEARFKRGEITEREYHELWYKLEYGD